MAKPPTLPRVTIAKLAPRKCLICGTEAVEYAVSYIKLPDSRDYPSPITRFTCKEHLGECARAVMKEADRINVDLATFMRADPNEQRRIRKEKSSFVACLRRQGYTYRQIADRFGFSTERARQLDLGYSRDVSQRVKAFQTLIDLKIDYKPR